MENDTRLMLLEGLIARLNRNSEVYLNDPATWITSHGEEP